MIDDMGGEFFRSEQVGSNKFKLTAVEALGEIGVSNVEALKDPTKLEIELVPRNEPNVKLKQIMFGTETPTGETAAGLHKCE